MAIPENQLETWSHQGATARSRSTYATVKNVLEEQNAPYNNRSYEVFLQGSYGNDTNIHADSDVDVVIRLSSVFYKDISLLPADDLAAYNAFFSDGGYSFKDFKADVIKQLQSRFGAAVQPGKRAIFVEGVGTRRDADVLAAVQFRKYLRFKSAADQSYVEGVCFWTSDGTQIVNYPKQHSANLTQKHQATNGWLKPTVRIFKNMRNAMVADSYLREGVAPSYFLEGMLWNVPVQQFGSNYQDSVVNAINWVINSNRGQLMCANGQHPLLASASPVSWNATDLQAYIDAFAAYWNAW